MLLLTNTEQTVQAKEGEKENYIEHSMEKEEVCDISNPQNSFQKKYLNISSFRSSNTNGKSLI